MADSPFKAEVQANDPKWTTVEGLIVRSGDKLVITASGQATFSNKTDAPTGPEGRGHSTGYRADHLPIGSLIARIGETGTPFGVGTGTTHDATADGQLQFHINDRLQDEAYKNNHGSFTAIVEGGWLDITAAASGTATTGTGGGTGTTGQHEPGVWSHIAMILDASGSMKQHHLADGTLRMKAAKQALIDLMHEHLPYVMPDGGPVGLRIFSGCDGLGELQWSDAHDPSDLIHAVENASAGGSTPLADAIRATAEELFHQRTDEGKQLLIIVTDGDETCVKMKDNAGNDVTDADGKPVFDVDAPMNAIKEIKSTYSQDILYDDVDEGLRVDVIGIDLSAESQARYTEPVNFSNITDQQGLTTAVTGAPASAGFTVKNAAGTEVASGDASQRVAVLAGTYTVSVGGQDHSATVANGATVTVP